jgi:cysteine desulfurase/selenocysteine lyase
MRCMVGRCAPLRDRLDPVMLMDDGGMDDSVTDDSVTDHSVMDDSAMDDSVMDDSVMDDPVMDDSVIDVERARRDTPGVRHVAHLNNAGASLPPTSVTAAVVAHLELEASIGGYEAAEAASERIDQTYASIARLIGADVDEVAVIENATRAWDMAFYAIAFEPGDRILTARSEYASNVIAMSQVARRSGAVIELIDDDAAGQVCVTDLQRRLTEGSAPVKLVAIGHVPTHGGLVNPVEAVGAACRHAGVLFLLDACQSVGQMPVDVAKIQCDVLVGTGRKFLRAPRGTGFLYVRRAVLDQLEPPFLDLHSATYDVGQGVSVRGDCRRFETWESNVAAKIGLGVAAEYALGWGLDAIERRVVELADHLRSELDAVDGVTVCDLGTRRCAIVTFRVADWAANEVRRMLGDAGVNVSVSTAGHAPFDLPDRAPAGLVRASVHYYNTHGEIDRLVRALRDRPRVAG